MGTKTKVKWFETENLRGLKTFPFKPPAILSPCPDATMCCAKCVCVCVCACACEACHTCKPDSRSSHVTSFRALERARTNLAPTSQAERDSSPHHRHTPARARTDMHCTSHASREQKKKVSLALLLLLQGI